MNRPLTHQQRAVYEFIRDKIVERGYGPTVREIGEHMHIKSPNGVVCHLRALERKGMITRTAHKSRAIELLDAAINYRVLGVPVVGDVTRGAFVTSPVGSDGHRPGALVSFKQLTAPENYALVVCDNSLLELQITRGDFLIVEPCDRCMEGQLVLAVSNDGSTILVKCFPVEARIRLEPVSSLATSTHLYSDEVSIVGMVIGVVRSLKPREHEAAPGGQHQVS